jgi:hypothetical protein
MDSLKNSRMARKSRRAAERADRVAILHTDDETDGGCMCGECCAFIDEANEAAARSARSSLAWYRGKVAKQTEGMFSLGNRIN